MMRAQWVMQSLQVAHRCIVHWYLGAHSSCSKYMKLLVTKTCNYRRRKKLLLCFKFVNTQRQKMYSKYFKVWSLTCFPFFHFVCHLKRWSSSIESKWGERVVVWRTKLSPNFLIVSLQFRSKAQINLPAAKASSWPLVCMCVCPRSNWHRAGRETKNQGKHWSIEKIRWCNLVTTFLYNLTPYVLLLAGVYTPTAQRLVPRNILNTAKC